MSLGALYQQTYSSDCTSGPRNKRGEFSEQKVMLS